MGSPKIAVFLGEPQQLVKIKVFKLIFSFFHYLISVHCTLMSVFLGSSPLSLLTSIPEAIGGAAVAAIKFITPKPSPASKLATPNNPATNTFSTIQPDVDLNQIIFGILGVAALGSVGYGVYANANNKKNRRISYQTSYSKRSVNSEGDQLWSQIEESIIKGKTETYFQNNTVNLCTIIECRTVLSLISK